MWGRGRPWGLVWCSKEATTQCWGLTGAPARRLGVDGNLRRTAFGPVNAKMHRVNRAVTLGDAATAVDVARRVDLSTVTVTAYARASCIPCDRGRPS